MVHDLLFRTLLLLGILGLSASLIWVWRQRRAAFTREPAVSWSPP